MNREGLLNENIKAPTADQLQAELAAFSIDGADDKVELLYRYQTLIVSHFKSYIFV